MTPIEQFRQVFEGNLKTKIQPLTLASCTITEPDGDLVVEVSVDFPVAGVWHQRALRKGGVGTLDEATAAASLIAETCYRVIVRKALHVAAGGGV